jgi:hypothetical protein
MLLADPGVYDIEVVLSGDNTKTTRALWRIGFRSAWSNDEVTMLGAVQVQRVARWPRRKP